MRFSRFVAIDWSGARGRRYAGIAVAECAAGDGRPRLVPAPDAWWSRSAVFEWLLTTLPERPALVGIDCAFALPFSVAARYFPKGGGDAVALWALVESVCRDHPDLLGAAFVEHPDFATDFWSRGGQPDWYRDPHRATEWACRAEGLGSPQSPYKLIGAKQVGRGALAGMRLLHRLRGRLPGKVAVWPFEEHGPGASVIVEIYPRLFLMRAGMGSRKIRRAEDVDRALTALGSRPAGLTGAVSDHEADALVSAAGLRRLAVDPRVWAPPGLDEDASLRDGWIFGVGLGPAADEPIPISRTVG